MSTCYRFKVCCILVPKTCRVFGTAKINGIEVVVFTLEPHVADYLIVYTQIQIPYLLAVNNNNNKVVFMVILLGSVIW